MRDPGTEEQHRVVASAALVTVPSGHYGYVPLAGGVGDVDRVDGRVTIALSFAVALLCVSVYRAPLLNDVAAMIAGLAGVGSIVGWRRVPRAASVWRGLAFAAVVLALTACVAGILI